MKRFKYNYLENTLSYQPIDEGLNGCWYQISEEKQFIRFNNQGFYLEPHNHWMTFAVYEQKIKVFYKYPHGSFNSNLDDCWNSERITYYRKYLPKEETLIFEFNFLDEVKKVAGKWVNKRTVN